MMSYSPNGVDPSSYPALSEGGERIVSQGKLQRPISAARRYGLALILVSAALGLAQTFLYYGLPLPFTAFALSAIAATFWYGGTKPGILAALISWLVRDAFFEPEVSAESRILYGLAYLVFALVMILVMRGRNELEARVAERTAELTKANEDLTREIARHKRTEEALRRSEAYLAEAQRLSHSGVSAYNETTILYGSEETYRIWGFDPAQGVPSREAVFQRIHPDDRDRMHAEVQRALGEKRRYSIAYRIALPDGTVKHLESIGQPVFSASGELVEIVATQMDVTERKQAEDRLRRSEAYLAEAQKLSHTATWAFNTTETLYWSDEGYRLWGLDPQEGPPTSETILQRIHPDDRDRVYEGALEAIREKRDHAVGFRIVLPDGTVKNIESCSRHLFSEDGELVEVLGTHIDVTERKRAEEALRESEAKIRRLVDANIIGIFIWDLEGRISEANDAFLRMVDYDREDLVSGRISWTELTPPEWRDPDVRHWLPELKATGSLQPFEKEYFRKDGSRVPVLIGIAAFEEGGNQGVAFVLDLTKRKRAENALRESEVKLRDYAETASDWFWEIDPDYKFTLLTENAFGSDPADRIGTACWEHALDLESEPEKWRLMQATIDSRKPFRDFVYCSKGRNGSPIYVKASGKPVFYANGEFRGYRGTGSDVTAIMHAQRVEASLRTELAHVSRVTTLGQLTASIAHEITQPIAAARNNARAAVNFLDKQPFDPGEVREALECVVADADRAGDIIDRIRDHMKKAPPRSDHLDLNKAINEVIVLARSEITKNGVSVQTRLAEGLISVKGDRVQLQQVVMNLILNAIEAMSSVEAGERELLISTEQNQTGDVLVAVRDSGPGIDPEHLERLFEAFYTTKSSGVGMGLSICRSITHAHGGRLWADVNEPRGAVFQFTLPGTEKEITNPVPAARQTAQRHEGTVSDGSHQLAYAGNKRPHRSRREPGQRRWGSQ
jgi:PAS domain S-box-containing protein